MREPRGGIASLALLGTTLAPAPSCCRGPAPVPMQPLDGGDIQQAGSLAHEHMTHEQWQRMALSSGWTPGEWRAHTKRSCSCICVCPAWPELWDAEFQNSQWPGMPQPHAQPDCLAFRPAPADMAKRRAWEEAFTSLLVF